MKFSGRIFSFILSALCVQGVMISGNNDMIYAQGNNKYIVGYLPDWSYGYYKDMDFTDLTHINIAIVIYLFLSSNFDIHINKAIKHIANITIVPQSL